MKTPPLLLGMALLFWGWQADSLWVGAAMGAVLEAARLIKARWDFTDEELRRIVVFCELAALAALAYAYSANKGPASLTGLAADPATYEAQRSAGNAVAHTSLALIRWLPMIFFLFAAAQTYSTRREIPVEVGSLFQWRRRKKAERSGQPWPAGKTFNAAWPFFAVCLLAASMHGGEVKGFFWGFVALMAWALWTLRARRFSAVVWALALGIAVAAGFFGRRGVMQIQHLVSNYNPAWVAELLARDRTDPTRSKTAIGQLGRIAQSGKIVIRLETPAGMEPPALLREASYGSYKSPWWFAGSTNQAYDPVNFETNGTSWVLLRDKKNTTSVTIASYLPRQRGVLPLPSGCGRLDNLDVDSLKTNLVGTAWAEGPGLVIFDARYAPGATMDSPASANEDLRVPSDETNALAQVIAAMQLDGFDDRRKLLKVRTFFADNFTYGIWQKSPRATNGTALGKFLLETRTGHCEYFATATTLLLRQLKLPARYAVGYVVHEKSGANKYVVRLRDAHAWTLVWNAATKTWEDFDTTPDSRNEEEARRASPFQFLSDGWSRAWFEFSKFRWGQSHVRQYVLWALVPVLGFLLYQIIFRKAWRRSSRKSAADRDREWPGRDSEFYQLERRLAVRIGPRRADEPLSRWLERAATEPSLAGGRELLGDLLKAHYRYRFDPQGLSADERETLRRMAGDCLKALESTARPNPP